MWKARVAQRCYVARSHDMVNAVASGQHERRVQQLERFVSAVHFPLFKQKRTELKACIPARRERPTHGLRVRG